MSLHLPTNFSLLDSELKIAIWSRTHLTNALVGRRQLGVTVAEALDLSSVTSSWGLSYSGN